MWATPQELSKLCASKSGMFTPIRATRWIQGVVITSSVLVWLSLAGCSGASLAR
jgi:hypothetical protein